MRRFHADLILLFCAVIWGTAFVFQKSAMSHIGPLTFVAARTLLAALALSPLAWREHHAARTNPPGHFLAIAGCGGLLFLIAGWLQQSGLQTASVTNTGFLTALYVVITPFIAWGLSGKVPNAIVWPAVVLSAFGTWLLGGGTLGGFSRGDLLVAASAVFWAAHVVVTGLAAVYARPIGFTAIQFSVVGVLASLGAAALEPVSAEGLRAAAIDIAYLGLLSSALAFSLLTVALQYTPPSETAVVVSTEVAFAALAAYLVLGERLSAIGWMGALLIGLSILLVQLGPALAPRARRG